MIIMSMSCISGFSIISIWTLRIVQGFTNSIITNRICLQDMVFNIFVFIYAGLWTDSKNRMVPYITQNSLNHI
jgi:hypothetical protein